MLLRPFAKAFFQTATPGGYESRIVGNWNHDFNQCYLHSIPPKQPVTEGRIKFCSFMAQCNKISWVHCAYGNWTLTKAAHSRGLAKLSGGVWAQVSVTSSCFQPYSQHDYVAHKCLNCNLILGHVCEYLHIVHACTHLSQTPTSSEHHFGLYSPSCQFKWFPPSFCG